MGCAVKQYMISQRRRGSGKRCALCGMECSVYMCQRCGNDLRALLVGSRDNRRDTRGRQVGEVGAGQPGIVWYIGRLREQAFLQSKLDGQIARTSKVRGYALVADQSAIDLLAQIRRTLITWNGTVLALSGLRTDEIDFGGQNPAEAPETALARFIAGHIDTLRKRCSSVHVLHTDLLHYAKEAFTILNRPPDNFCGPCPVTLESSRAPGGEKCGTLLYAAEDATQVQCDSCRSWHDVDRLREAMKDAIRDMVFTGPELRRLMETRLGDRIPESTFRLLRADGRLRPRRRNDQGEEMFTYADVCGARLKPAPGARKKRTGESNDSTALVPRSIDQHV